MSIENNFTEEMLDVDLQRRQHEYETAQPQSNQNNKQTKKIMEKTENTNRERLKELYGEYNLTPEDVFKHKKFNYIMITRTGVEKIMARDDIKLSFEVIENDMLNGCVIKATAEMTKDGQEVRIETFGSATTKNCQLAYYPEMAEKRAKVRAILQITEFYSCGVYSEDEADSFKSPSPEPKTTPTPKRTGDGGLGDVMIDYNDQGA